MPPWSPATDRLFGILFGMVLLEPVVLAAHLIARRGLKGTAAKPAAGLADK